MPFEKASPGLELRHYSEHEELYQLVPIVQRSTDFPYEKPRGLWISVPGEDDWPSWCKGESWGLEKLQWERRVQLAPDAQVAHLKSASDIDRFTERYRISSKYGAAISWWHVEADYDGLIISPYQWERRLMHETSWYYGWDCAAGCIWHPRAIGNIGEARRYEVQA